MSGTQVYAAVKCSIAGNHIFPNNNLLHCLINILLPYLPIPPATKNLSIPISKYEASICAITVIAKPLPIGFLSKGLIRLTHRQPHSSSYFPIPGIGFNTVVPRIFKEISDRTYSFIYTLIEVVKSFVQVPQYEPCTCQFCINY